MHVTYPRLRQQVTTKSLEKPIPWTTHQLCKMVPSDNMLFAFLTQTTSQPKQITGTFPMVVSAMRSRRHGHSLMPKTTAWENASVSCRQLAFA